VRFSPGPPFAPREHLVPTCNRACSAGMPGGAPIYYGRVAQCIERQSSELNVAGETPATATKLYGGMVELGDTPDLGSGSLQSAGASPATPTI
jgi:hypothetical protein